MASMLRKELPPIVSTRILKRNFETSLFWFIPRSSSKLPVYVLYLPPGGGVEVHQEEEEKKKKLVGG